MESLCYEEFTVGGEWMTPARRITDAEIEAFAAVSEDRNPLHLDEAYAAGTVFGGRIAHGILGLAVASGLLNQSRLTAGTLVALLGLEWSFRRPVRPGDSVRIRVRVDETRATRDPGRGLVRLCLDLLNQDDEVVQDGSFTMLVRRRGGEDRV